MPLQRTVGKYAAGKREGWWLMYANNMDGKTPEYLKSKSLYRHDSLVEQVEYGWIVRPDHMDGPFYAIPKHRYYICATHDTVFSIDYFTHRVEDSGKVWQRTYWTNFGHADYINLVRNSPRPPGAKFVRSEENHYPSRRIWYRTDSLLAQNEVVKTSYYENGQIEKVIHYHGVMEIRHYQRAGDSLPLFFYYLHDSIHYTHHPDSLFFRTQNSATYDSSGLVVDKLYTRFEDTIVVSVDTTYFPHGKVREIHFLRYVYKDGYKGGLLLSERKITDPAGNVKSKGFTLTDSVSVDSTFYPGGKLREVSINYRNRNYTRKTFYENGNLQTLMVRDVLKNLYREEEYDEAGKLIKHN